MFDFTADDSYICTGAFGRAFFGDENSGVEAVAPTGNFFSKVSLAAVVNKGFGTGFGAGFGTDFGAGAGGLAAGDTVDEEELNCFLLVFVASATVFFFGASAAALLLLRISLNGELDTPCSGFERSAAQSDATKVNSILLLTSTISSGVKKTQAPIFRATLIA